jgi:hypothetical protein
MEYTSHSLAEFSNKVIRRLTKNPAIATANRVSSIVIARPLVIRLIKEPSASKFENYRDLIKLMILT